MLVGCVSLALVAQVQTQDRRGPALDQLFKGMQYCGNTTKHKLTCSYFVSQVEIVRTLLAEDPAML
jgi:hypothetical protein